MDSHLIDTPLLAFCFCLATIASSDLAAQDATPAESTRYFYALEQLAGGSVAARGSFVLSRDPSTGRTSGGLPDGSLILAPETRYRYWLLDTGTFHVGFRDFRTPPAGQRFTIPTVPLGKSEAIDFDGDGLDDDAEFIIGTNAGDKDTDLDGIEDGAEIGQGLDPLDGLPARTGVIASADTPGIAVDICAVNDIAVVGDSDEGISVFNVFNGMDPVIISQVDTPGTAARVACAGRYVAVADVGAGLTIVDIVDPPRARVTHGLSFEGSVKSVTAAAGVAYVGLSTSELAIIDLSSGGVLERVPVPEPIEDLAFGGDVLYLLGKARLHAMILAENAPTITGSVDSPYLTTLPDGFNKRLQVGGGIAYATHALGYNTFDLADPEHPVLIQADRTPQFGWQQLAITGSGLGVAAVGPNPRLGVPIDVSLYDIRDPTQTDVFLAEFETPGKARALSIYNGLAYVADDEAGLQVVNYLSSDSLGVPPTIELNTNFPLGEATEGQIFRATAMVSDDVQVRNVEFYVDSIKVATDGNSPFEHRFVTPRLSERAGFSLRARASDTGGNATWSDELLYILVEDATPPRVLRLSPPFGSFRRDVATVAAFLSERLDPESVTPGSFTLMGEAGAIGGGTLQYRDGVRGAFLTFAAPLEVGVYTARIAASWTDPSGNALSEEKIWSFTVFDIESDTDGDCLPDAIEAELGLNAGLQDSDGDGIPDGEEDTDGDTLLNCAEILRRIDPGRADTDGDLIPDAQELALGIEPTVADTDRDGFIDGDEVQLGSDPLDPGSLPIDPGATYRHAFGATVSLFNATYPSAGPVREAAVLPTVSLFSATYPSAAPVREAAGPVGSVENETVGN